MSVEQLKEACNLHFPVTSVRSAALSYLTRIFFYKTPVCKKPRIRYLQIIPNLRNLKNYKKSGILT